MIVIVVDNFSFRRASSNRTTSSVSKVEKRRKSLIPPVLLELASRLLFVVCGDFVL